VTDTFPHSLPRGNARSYTDSSGTTWAVYDCFVAGGRLVVLNIGATGAEFRVFVRVDGVERIYSFGAGETRAPEPVDYERQLAESRVLRDGAPPAP
jgi:hypothetical protein